MAKRILRLTASPHAIAGGVAAGVFASFTPFMGFHFLIAFLLAYVIAGNFLAAAMGTFFGNPISFPFIWASTFSTGRFILHGPLGDGGSETVDPSTALSALAQSNYFELGVSGLFERLAGLWEPVFLPMLIGAVPLGTLFAILAYMITRWASGVFRKSRTKVIADKASALKQAAQDRATGRAHDKAADALMNKSTRTG